MLPAMWRAPFQDSAGPSGDIPRGTLLARPLGEKPGMLPPPPVTSRFPVKLSAFVTEPTLPKLSNSHMGMLGSGSWGLSGFRAPGSGFRNRLWPKARSLRSSRR